MCKIHLLARGGMQNPGFQRIDDGHRTGWWAISEDRARRLIGGMVFLHETKATPSYYGGEIVGCERGAAGTPDADRIGFLFRYRVDARQVRWDWGSSQPNDLAEMSVVCP